MALLTDRQIRVRKLLQEGSFLIDPKYTSDPTKYERLLKEKCSTREIYEMRDAWPDFVEGYAKKWEAEKKAKGKSDGPA
jgi:hypothetical protein